MQVLQQAEKEPVPEKSKVEEIETISSVQTETESGQTEADKQTAIHTKKLPIENDAKPAVDLDKDTGEKTSIDPEPEVAAEPDIKLPVEPEVGVQDDPKLEKAIDSEPEVQPEISEPVEEVTVRVRQL